MIKKLKCLVILVLLVSIVLPITVKADDIPVNIGGYSKQATVGSELVFRIRGVSKFDGTIEYNKDELEYVTISEEVASFIEGVSPQGTFNVTTNTPGVLKFTHKEASTDIINVLVTFKVKSAPASGKTTITYTPNDTGIIYGKKNISKEFDILKTTEITENKKIETKCPDTTDSNTETALYAFCGLSGILMLAVLILAIKKK